MDHPFENRPKKKKALQADAPMAPPPRARHERKYLHVSEWRRLLAAARADGLRSTALILVLYETGARRGEVGLMRMSYTRDLRKKNQLYVWRGKGSNDGNVTLSSVCKQALLDWIDEAYPDVKARNDNDFIFPGKRMSRFSDRKQKGLSGRQVYNIFHDLCVKANLPKMVMHPHAMKHSRVQHLLEAGSEKDIDPNKLYQSIAAIIGHAAARTTIQHYSAATSMERRLVEDVTDDLVK